MSKTVLDLTCSACGKTNTRRYSWMDPSKFSDPKNACMTSAYHCAFCDKGQAIRLKFLEGEVVEVENVIDFATLIKDEPGSFYIGGATSDEGASREVLTEDAALSLLNDAPTD